MADLKLEVVVLPVADVDRAKAFYEGLGWRLDADLGDGEKFRVVQLTPPGSGCSIHFGIGVTSAEPGSAVAYLIVTDLEESRTELTDRGAEVGEVFHREDGEEVSGPDPEGRSYFSLASFTDPDGNRWLLQEITERLPGRV
jgi:catechol 2,3-dioxygenase-like lactoylglutathione lyase family enzyme